MISAENNGPSALKPTDTIEHFSRVWPAVDIVTEEDEAERLSWVMG
jgi:hypothetical protein